METIIYKWLVFLLPPLTSLITWLAAKYTRKSTTLQTMQASIDMLVQKNSELYEEVVQLRVENTELKAGQVQMQTIQEANNREIIELRKKIDALKKK